MKDKGSNSPGTSNEKTKHTSYRSMVIAIVSEDTLGSLLCIYLKGMHEVQRLTSTSLRDIHDRIKYGRVL